MSDPRTSTVLSRALSGRALLVFGGIAIAGVIAYLVFRPVPPGPLVIARVGGTLITTDEFRLCYEAGLPELKKGATTRDRKRAFLDAMINEKLLAVRGYDLGLDNTPGVRTSELLLRQELLVSALIDADVKAGISIPDSVVRDAITRSSVSFRFRYWAEPTMERAEAVAAAMRVKGFAAVTSDLAAHNPEFGLDPQKLETGYVTWLDLAEPLLHAIQNLERGVISDPVELDGAYFIFQVLDIRRTGLTENELIDRAPTMRKVLVARALQEGTKQYVAAAMIAKSIVTRGPAFRMLAAAIAEWRMRDTSARRPFTETVGLVKDDSSAMGKLLLHLDDTLVVSRDGSIPLRGMLALMNYKYVLSVTGNDPALPGNVNTAIAVAARDYFLALDAQGRKLDRLPSVREETRMWKDRWVYEATRDRLRAAPPGDRLITPGAKAMLQQTADSVRAHVRISIDYSVLDTMQVSDEGAKPGMMMQMIKGGVGRMAAPVIDPLWAR